MAKTLAEFVADIKTQLAATAAAVTAQTTVIGSVKTMLDGQAAQIAALKQQIKDLIDAGGDVATLQPVLDMITALETETKANTQKLTDAAVANT